MKMSVALVPIIIAAVFGPACATTRRGALNPMSQSQKISRAGTQAPTDGPSEYFTGRVRIQPLSPADGDINASTAYVRFAPGLIVEGIEYGEARWCFLNCEPRDRARLGIHQGDG